MVFDNIEAEAKSLDEKTQRVEQTTDLLDKRILETKIFTPKDFACDFKMKEIQYYNYVKMYFKEEKFFRLFLKHFGILEAKEPSVHNIGEIMLFLKLIDEGIIKTESAGNKSILKIQGGEFVYEDTERFW